jgi:parvulin-like peptidyl-prolyl isomerase
MMHEDVAPESRSAPDVDRLVARLVNDVLFAQEARALGLDGDPEVVAKLERRREQLALARLEREEIVERARPSREQVRRHYDEQFRRVTLRVATLHERAEAETFLQDVRGGADFATLAKERSRDPYAPRGGLLSDVARADLDRDVAAVAFGEQPKGLAGPIRTDLGWSVIEVESFTPADPARFAREEPRLRDLVAFGLRQELREQLARRLRERHPVVVDEAAAFALVPERKPDGRLFPRVGDPAAVIARIGDFTLTAEEYGRALQLRWSGVRNEEAARAAMPIVLEKLLGERLLLVEALARGYQRGPDVDRALRGYERELLVPRFLEQVVARSVEVTEAEKVAYYDAHRDRFRRPPRVHLAQLTVPARDQVDRLAEQARGGADFAWLARQHSTDRLKSSGGDRGWMVPTPGVDAFQDDLLASRAGEVLGPYGEEGNWRLVKVTARQEQGEHPYAQVSGNVREAVYTQELMLAIDAAVRKLRERSEIAVDDALLARLGISGTVAAAEPKAGGMPGH